MPRRRAKTLTEAELRLMNVLWERGPSTVAAVADALKKPKLAYNSVLTTLRILERKGYVSRSREGRAHVYAAAVEQNDARRQALDHLLERFFQNSPELLVQNLIEEEDWDAEDLAELSRGLRDIEGNDSAAGDVTGKSTVSSKKREGPKR